MRILHVMGASAQGGAENTFLDTVKALVGHAEQCIVSKPHLWRDKQLAQLPITLRHASFSTAPWHMGTRLTVRRAIHQFRPTLIQSWMRRGAAFVPHHTPVPHITFWGSCQSRDHFKHCDHLLAPSANVLNHARTQGWPAWQTHELVHYTADTVERERDSCPFSTPTDCQVILGMGRLVAEKGFDTLLRAYASLDWAQRQNTQLWICGDGPERDALEALATDLTIKQQTLFLGWRHDQHRIMRLADLCVFPTHHEGFGLITLEAWAQKTPLIASRVPGPQDLIRHGEDGLLVVHDDIAGFGQAISRCLSDSTFSEQLRSNGYQRFLASHTRKYATDQLLTIYNQISQRGNR